MAAANKWWWQWHNNSKVTIPLCSYRCHGTSRIGRQVDKVTPVYSETVSLLCHTLMYQLRAYQLLVYMCLTLDTPTPTYWSLMNAVCNYLVFYRLANKICSSFIWNSAVQHCWRCQAASIRIWENSHIFCDVIIHFQYSSRWRRQNNMDWMGINLARIMAGLLQQSFVSESNLATNSLQCDIMLTIYTTEFARCIILYTAQLDFCIIHVSAQI